MGREGWRPKSGSKQSYVPGQKLMGPTSCPRIKEKHYGIERVPTTAGYKSFLGIVDFLMTVKKIDHLGLAKQS